MLPILSSGKQFSANARVANALVRAYRIKAWLMANAQIIAVCLSGMMMYLGVLLMYTGVKLEWNTSTVTALLAAWPLAVTTAPIAVIIESMTITVANGYQEVKRKVEQELQKLAAVKGEFTEEEYRAKAAMIKRQVWTPRGLLVLFSLFSISGSELFWHTITASASVFFQGIGIFIASVVSVSLIYLETHQDMIERSIKRAITSSTLQGEAMDMDAKTQIITTIHEERSAQLTSAEHRAVIREAALRSVHALSAETVQTLGVSITASQLQRMVEERRTAREVAEKYLATGETSDMFVEPTRVFVQDTDPLQAVNALECQPLHVKGLEALEEPCQPLHVKPVEDREANEKPMNYGNAVAALYRQNPQITAIEVAKKLGCSRATATAWLARCKPVN